MGTLKLALHRMMCMPPEERWASANSYFGLLRQAPSSHEARAALAKLAILQRLSVNRSLTKTYRPA